MRVIDLDTGNIDGFAGTGEAGYAGDGGPARAATLYRPQDLEIGPEGDVLTAWQAARHLNEIVHGLHWQDEVERALHQQPLQ